MNKEQHLVVIKQVLAYLNSRKDNPYILKGGAALYLCYSLNRFSEDVNLDAPSAIVAHDRFEREIQKICNAHDYSYRIGKNTAASEEAYIDYGSAGTPLKVEVSYRRKEIPQRLICIRENIQVYTLDEMTRLKAAAYNGGDNIRDLYDVSYICTHFYEQLGQSARDALRAAFEYKDLGQFDYIVSTQNDALIDVDLLKTMFLKSFDKLGLLSPHVEEDAARSTRILPRGNKTENRDSATSFV